MAVFTQHTFCNADVVSNKKYRSAISHDWGITPIIMCCSNNLKTISLALLTVFWLTIITLDRSLTFYDVQKCRSPTPFLVYGIQTANPFWNHLNKMAGWYKNSRLALMLTSFPGHRPAFRHLQCGKSRRGPGIIHHVWHQGRENLIERGYTDYAARSRLIQRSTISCVEIDGSRALCEQ